MERTKGKFAKRLAASCGLLLTLAAGVVSAGLPVLDSATVRGRADDGSVICRGAACADVLASMRIDYQIDNFWAEMPAEGPELSYEDFCRQLSSKKPSGCNAASPPIMAGINPAYRPNGCGPGGVVNAIGTALALLVTETGDIDEPVRGASFLTACNGHDTCWSSGANRIACDAMFESAMRGSCETLGSGASGYYDCHGFAGLYASLVRSSKGTEIYNSRIRDRECAVWAGDMKANACKA